MSAPIKGINHLLHDLRSAHLRRLPAVSGSILSAGCARTWYFVWIAKQTGFAGRHIRIEYYTPKPADPPGDVEWIENTVADMNAVADSSCELVFSGQNLEHLWPEEVIGFFLESARVLEPGSWLVVDSPNRLIASALGWGHPEHMIEFTPPEARRLAELAGFEIEHVVGMWLCRDPRSGRALPFDPLVVDPEWSLPERVLEAERHPDDSFLWWLVARRSGTPQLDALQCSERDLLSRLTGASAAVRRRRWSAVASRWTFRGDGGPRAERAYVIWAVHALEEGRVHRRMADRGGGCVQPGRSRHSLRRSGRQGARADRKIFQRQGHCRSEWLGLA